MASTEDQKKELESGFTLVQRKNMRRGKPQQQIYRPGSGPLRKSNPLEESESDTTLVVNSRHNQSRHDFRHVEDSRNKSEGSSPRDKSTEIDKAAAQFRDISLNKDYKDSTKRIKKPEQMLYVPKPIAQAREISASQDINRNSHSRAQSNGNDKNPDYRENYGNKPKPYIEKRRNDRGGDQEDSQARWRDRSPGHTRHRQGSEPRDGNVSSWNRTRDTRSVEPSAHTNRNYENIQSKPPSGRRHSSVGLEDRFTKLPTKNLDNLPPRLRRKYFQDNNLPEESWDGTSLTFQGHSHFNNSKNSSNYHPLNTVYNTLPNSQNYPNQNLSNMGYHTLPNKPRGRGRWFQEQDNFPGQGYRSMTPDNVRSPSNSRPHTPPMGGMRNMDNRTHSPELHHPKSVPHNLPGRYGIKYSEDRPREMDNRKDYDNQRNYNGPRRQDISNDNNRYDRKRQEIHDTDASNRNTRRDREVTNRRDRETPNRDVDSFGRDNKGRGNYGRESHDMESNHRNTRRDRDNITRKDKDIPNRDGETVGREGKGRGNYNRDRRDRRDKRSRSRDYYRNTNSRGGRYEGNRHYENKSVSNIGNSEIKNNVEEQIPPVSPEAEKQTICETLVVNTTLDWSEEVELNDRLEAEIFSDAPTRSSSITSLHEVSTMSLPPNINNPPQSISKRTKRKNRKSSRNRSGTRESSRSRTRAQRTRQNSTTSIDSREGFKHPQDNYFGRRRTSKDRRDSSYDRYRNNSRNPSRESSWDRQNVRSGITTENWRDEMVRNKQQSEREARGKLEEIKNVDASTKKAGVIVLAQPKAEPAKSPTTNPKDQPRYPETRKSPGQQKSLFDPNNPNKPILVKSPGTRVSVPGFSDNTEESPPQINTADQFGNVKPAWYDEKSEEFKSCYFPDLLRDIKRADLELQYIVSNGWLLVNWGLVDKLRHFLKEALEYLLCKSIKFCQTENVEQHFWKILYHNIIEVTRNAFKSDLENKEKYKAFLIYLIDEGTKYFEQLLGLLESTYDFKLSAFLGENNMAPQKGLGLVGLALVSAQKLFLFLGDLGRYREEVNETSNYGKCRLWYIKSQEINPKNGKPYNQLAVLAVCTRRKLDAVYYYMRSLMSSNPVLSAKQSLNALFDEIRKKYEQGEKKRREERLERQRLQMKQKESEDSASVPGSLRKETWIHPEGGRRVHRTTQANPDENDSEEEDLASLSSVEVNKRFVISYLHVHGKLITKIGMETFQETALQMLKEFRALLQQSPVPLPCNRFLQLLALNMYAIESTQLKDPDLQSGYRSEFQERALVVSLQMFDLILERCIAVLRDHLAHQDSDVPVDFLPPDGEVLLPAVKVWCDWMLCHTDVWNPPPSTRDFKIKGSSGDAWCRLATLMNLLEQMDQSASKTFLKEHRDGYEQIRLPEDSVLNGFTPLMYTYQEGPTYAPKDIDAERAHFSLRLSRLLFFGTEYLCGVDPPVLKLEIDDNSREYVSVVNSAGSRDSPPSPHELAPNNDILLESFSGDEDVGLEEEKERMASNAPSEIRDLLTRKVELEKRKRSQELHMQRVKKILSQSVVSVHMEVQPKYLVPDTNCFIDHLENIRSISQCHNYTLMVPIVVLSELEGLSRGGKAPTPDSRHLVDPIHVVKVANAAKEALEFLKTRHLSVKCVTTKGRVIASTRFSTEDDAMWNTNVKNDDKILTTCLELCKGHKEQTQSTVEGEPRHLVREVVLLTEDRNLRVKAHARDVPVRELPDFMRWAGLG